jgi:hypothetical protein
LDFRRLPPVVVLTSCAGLTSGPGLTSCPGLTSSPFVVGLLHGAFTSGSLFDVKTVEKIDLGSTLGKGFPFGPRTTSGCLEDPFPILIGSLY